MEQIQEYLEKGKNTQHPKVKTHNLWSAKIAQKQRSMIPDVEKVSQKKKKPRNETKQDPVGLRGREVFLSPISGL